MNWSYQGTKACTVLVGDNTESKSMSSETNKTTSSSSTSISRTKQQSSTSGGMSSFNGNLVDPIILRKRRNTFNQHDSHQAVVPSESEVTPGKSDVQLEQLTDLHEDYLDKVVHGNTGRVTKVNKVNESRRNSMKRLKFKAANKLSRRSIVFQNNLSDTFTDSSYNNFLSSPFPSTISNSPLNTLHNNTSTESVTSASVISQDLKSKHNLERASFLKNMFTKKMLDLEVSRSQEHTQWNISDEIFSTATTSLNSTTESENQVNFINSSFEAWKEAETRSTIKSVLNSPINNNLTKGYKVLQDCSRPLYNVDQEEIEIIKLQEETTTKNKINEAKETIINKVDNSKSFYNLKTSFNKSEDFLTKQNKSNEQSGNMFKNELPSNAPSNTSITNKIDVFFPGTSFSPSKMHVNVAISIEDKPGSSSLSKPVFSLSVSIPTVENTNYLLPNINISHHPSEQLLINNITQKAINHDEIALTITPEIPTLAPPVWAGGECECSCPCMDTNDDDSVWQSFPDTLMTEKYSDQSFTEELYLKTTTDLFNSSNSLSTDNTTLEYSHLESTSKTNCSRYPLSFEPTILILEGKMSIYSNMLECRLNIFSNNFDSTFGC